MDEESIKTSLLWPCSRDLLADVCKFCDVDIKNECADLTSAKLVSDGVSHVNRSCPIPLARREHAHDLSVW
jgi:hypothetical protein